MGGDPRSPFTTSSVHGAIKSPSEGEKALSLSLAYSPQIGCIEKLHPRKEKEASEDRRGNLESERKSD